MKPIEFHTEIENICYEPSLGRGTQLIAAKKTSRRCFAIKKEPIFVDVAVLRYETFTGQKTVKEEVNL